MGQAGSLTCEAATPLSTGLGILAALRAFRKARRYGLATGRHAGDLAPRFTSWRLLPSAFMTQTENLPVVAKRANAMRLPSGDQSGCRPLPRERLVPPVAGIVAMPPFGTTYTSERPSGDQSGSLPRVSWRRLLPSRSAVQIQPSSAKATRFPVGAQLGQAAPALPWISRAPLPSG